MNTAALPADSLITTTIAIQDMHCAACSSKVSKALSELQGIGVVRFNPIHRQVFIEHASTLNPATLVRQIERAGFQPSLVDSGAQRSNEGEDLLRRAGVSALLMMQVMMGSFALYAGLFSDMETVWIRILAYASLLLSIPVVTWCAVPFYRNALQSRRGLSMDTPIALAIVIGFVVSLVNTLRGIGDVYYDAVTMFATIMLVARYFDQRLRDRLRVVEDLQDSLPRQVCKQINGVLQTVPSAAVLAGDVLWITEGEQLVADGCLMGDQAMLDEVSFTGESEWRKLQTGGRLHAGTFNRGAAFFMRVTAGPNGTRLAAIDAISAHALAQKLELSSMTDRVAAIFIPVILSLATLTTVFWLLVDPAQAVNAGLAVLIVSCPCALALAVPAAMHASLARLRQAGILLKSTAALERLPDIRVICFDKTGTLTEGKPQLVSIVALKGFDENFVLQCAASLEKSSEHPLALAFMKSVDQRKLKLSDAQDFESFPGKGVSGIVGGKKIAVGNLALLEMLGIKPIDFSDKADQLRSKGETVVFTVIDGQLAGIFGIADPIRERALQALNELRTQGLRIIMLTGDNEKTAQAVAARLGIDEVKANVLPAQKSEVNFN